MLLGFQKNDKKKNTTTTTTTATTTTTTTTTTTSDSDLCPYCRKRALSGLNETNKERHLEKCKTSNPYPRKKPLKQSKLGFLPSLQHSSESLDIVTEPALVTEPDHEVENDNHHHDPLLDLDEIGEVMNDECSIPTLELNDNKLVEDAEDASNVPSRTCNGFKPVLENFFENFAFQLLPTIP